MTVLSIGGSYRCETLGDFSEEVAIPDRKDGVSFI